MGASNEPDFASCGSTIGPPCYSDYDTMLKTLTDQLGRGSYLLGERFSAVDVLWGTALSWTVKFGLVPDLPGPVRQHPFHGHWAAPWLAQRRVHVRQQPFHGVHAEQLETNKQRFSVPAS